MEVTVERGNRLVPQTQSRLATWRLSLFRMNFRRAILDDCERLAQLNHQLLQDEGHRNQQMSLSELEQRMRGWLAGEYAAVIFEDEGEIVAYALYCEQAEAIYLRQLFVVRHHRRQGIGRKAVEILRKHIWPASKRLTVDVLVRNAAAIAFWHSVGYRDYCLTLEILPGSSSRVGLCELN